MKESIPIGRHLENEFGGIFACFKDMLVPALIIPWLNVDTQLGSRMAFDGDVSNEQACSLTEEP